MKRHVAFPSLLLLVVLASCSLFAQKITGTITGVVSDPNGAVISGAAVSTVNQATGTRRNTTANSNGVFTVTELEPGDYTVTVSNAGFKEVSERNVALHVADITRLDIKLPVGSASERVDVEASVVQVETETGTLGNVITGQQVRELPLNGRNFVQLTTLIPGASTAEGFDPKNKGLLAGVDISFSGAPANANQWLVDGANNNDVGSQRTILIYPSIEGIEEFKILRNSYGPEYGGAGGAQVNIVTRGGGNNFHGSAFYFGRNDALNAKNYILGANGPNCTPGDLSCTKQKLRRNDYGYTVGGPIKKDKLFVFWSEEWNKERRGAVRSAYVPTLQERTTGNFSDCPANAPKDPTTKMPFPGNQIPAAQLSPGGVAYLSQLPVPNTANPCSNQSWISSVNVPIDWREENVRGDYNITKSTTLMIKYTQDAWTNGQHAYGEGGLWGEQSFPAVSDSWSQPSKMAVGKLTTTLSSNSVNDFQFSWSNNQIVIAKAGDNPGLSDQINGLVPTVYPNSGKLHAGSLPEPICWCSTFLGQIGPWSNRQDLFNWKDDFSKVSGKHTFKTGIYYSKNNKDEEAGDEAGAFWGPTGYKSNWSGDTGNFYGNFLLKGMLFGSGENQANTITPVRWHDLEFYAGDSWKIHPRVTLEYGARWSFMQPEYLENNNYASFDPALYLASAAGDPCNGIVLAAGGANTCSALGSKLTPAVSGNRSIIDSNHHLIAPRFGFAWDVYGNAKFVLRGGVGQFFSRDPVGIALRVGSSNAPYSVSSAPERTLDGPFVQGVNLFDFSASGKPSQGLENNTNLANNWQWNLTTEMGLGKNAKLELGWVGLRGVHLESSSQLNQVAPANRLAYAQASIAQNSGAQKALLPFGPLTTGSLVEWNHRGDSIYHSLQSMFSWKLGHNSIFQSSYTWSKNLADTTLAYVNTNTGIQDSYNSRSGRGPSDFDRRHIFNMSLVYNLPELQGSNGFLKGAFGGWELNSVANFTSGPAITVGGSVNTVGAPTGIGNSNVTSSRPLRDFSQPCHLDNATNRQQWLNPLAFTWNGYTLGTNSNTGQGQCSGPGVQSVDLGFIKNFILPWNGNKLFGEKSRIQFRLESFNLLNHPMFRFNGANLNYDVTGATFTSNTVTGSSLPNTSTFGRAQPNTLIGNREIQYALKLIF